jgi:aryl-alcohol dehydrogenase-like predicted oxidoreductase
MGASISRGIAEAAWTREALVVTTKLFFGTGRGGANAVGLSRKHIVEGLDASLRRLGLAYVDVVYAHRPDPLTPIEEVVRAFNHVIDKGQAFYWGTSEWSAAAITEAVGVAARLGLIGPIVEQPEYNLFARQRVASQPMSALKAGARNSTMYS